MKASMDREITDQEIREDPLFNEWIRSPWPWWIPYGSFQKAWFILGRVFMDAVKSFFLFGKLLKDKCYHSYFGAKET
jgi:hypothetical protein